MKTTEKNLDYYRKNAEEDYLTTPISVLRYISEMEAALRQPLVSGSSFDWDKFANALKDEFGESLVEEDGSEEDAYNWWLTDVTATDIVEFIKNYR